MTGYIELNTSISLNKSINSFLNRSKNCSELDSTLLNAAVSLVFYVEDKTTSSWQGLQLLLMQRAEHPKDPWSGHIAFPGGVVENDDTDTLAAAIRETHEEFGFQLTESDWLGSMPPVLGPIIGDSKTVQVYPHIFLLHEMPNLQINEEVQSAFWVSIDRLSQSEFVYKFSHPLMPSQQMLGIDLGAEVNVPLWGLSMEILYQFYAASNWPVEQELKTFV